jgi:hypothetical protein
MEAGQVPNLGGSAKEKKNLKILKVSVKLDQFSLVLFYIGYVRNS